MLTINGKELRNLEEQVLANKENFENLVASGNVLDEFGIKVVGEVPNVEDLPAEDSEQFEALEYGDAYAVGIEPPYELYIKTRANDTHENDYWLDIGEFPKAGPEGPQGPQGIRGLQGVRGSIWTSSGSAPSVSHGQNLNDQHLNTLTGDVYQRENNQWVSTGSIKGPQGVQGPQGPIGPAGPQGIQGIQGPQGEPGEAFTIIGTLTSTAQLPDPTSIPRNDAYLVGVTQPYDLYVIVGEDELTWLNAGQVSGVKGDQGDTGPQGPQGPQGTAGQQGERGVSTLSLNQLQYGFLKQANWYKVNDSIIATEDFTDEDIQQSFTKGKVYQVTQVSPLQIADANMSIIGPAGEGIPSGGTQRQFLMKTDGTDYNTEWKTITLHSGLSSTTSDIDVYMSTLDDTVIPLANNEYLHIIRLGSTISSSMTSTIRFEFVSADSAEYTWYTLPRYLWANGYNNRNRLNADGRHIKIDATNQRFYSLRTTNIYPSSESQFKANVTQQYYSLSFY